MILQAPINLHLIIKSPDISGFIRDFKRHTSREIHKNIVAAEPTIEKLFEEPDKTYTIWQNTNMPIIIENEKVFLQKLNYIQENPVRKNYVQQAEHWYWSSVNPKCELKANDINE